MLTCQCRARAPIGVYAGGILKGEKPAELAHKVGSKVWQLVLLTACPSVFHNYVLTFDETRLRRHSPEHQPDTRPSPLLVSTGGEAAAVRDYKKSKHCRGYRR